MCLCGSEERSLPHRIIENIGSHIENKLCALCAYVVQNIECHIKKLCVLCAYVVQKKLLISHLHKLKRNDAKRN